MIEIPCATCKHFNRDVLEINTCTAFEEIPDDIVNGLHSHRDPFTDAGGNALDRDIHWEPLPRFDWMDIPDQLESTDPKQTTEKLTEQDPDKPTILT